MDCIPTQENLTINIEAGEAGLFHATSPQVPELFVTGESIADTLAKVPETLDGLTEA